MDNIVTTVETKRIAKSFRSFCSFLGDYRYINWNSLPEEDRSSIWNAEWVLINFALDISTGAVDISIPQVKECLAIVQTAADQLELAIGHSTSNQLIVDLATEAANLANSITVGNRLGIERSVQRLLMAV